MKVKKIKKVRVYEEIVEQLKNIIIKGELKTGERLPSERELAEEFDVSRVSIRQALTVLETLGLIERKIGGGTYSVSPNRDILSQRLSEVKTTITEPLEVRLMIEPKIAKLAAERANEQDIKELEKYLEIQEKKIKDGKLIINEDSEFHYAIAKATNNNIIVKLVETIHDMLWNTRENSISAEEGAQRSYQGHCQIFQAIKNKDGHMAYEAMQEHLKEVEKLILLSLKNK